MRVLEEGILPNGLNTTIGSVLKFVGHTPLASVTLEHLLFHRSGIVEDLSPSEELALHKIVGEKSPQEQRKQFCIEISKKDLAHEPGKNYGPYSNAGFDLLSVIIENLLNEPWEEIVRKKIAEPLGMTTLNYGLPVLGDNYAVGHDEEDVPIKNRVEYAWNRSSMSMYSTLEDWAKFAQMHARALSKKSSLEEVKISAPLAQKMHTPGSPLVNGEKYFGNEPANGYAMGWKCVWEDSPETTEITKSPSSVLWHFGTNFLFNSGIYICTNFPENLIILCGSNSGSMVARVAFRLCMENIINLLWANFADGKHVHSYETSTVHH